MLLTTLIKQTKVIARKRYGRLSIAIWYAFLGNNSVRAYVINLSNRMVMRKGPLASSPKAALMALKEMLKEENFQKVST